AAPRRRAPGRHVGRGRPRARLLGGSSLRAARGPYRGTRHTLNYQPRWLLADCLAGITLAAYAVPVALAYATLARLPPEVGIYGYLLGGLGYAALGSSRHLAIGPTSAISLLVGASIAPMAAGDPVRLAQVASLAALLVAGLAVTAWALRLSTLTSFVSDTILLGFK